MKSVKHYSNEGKDIFDIAISFGYTRIVHLVVNENDNLLNIATTFCDTHNLQSELVKEVANKLKEAIQMSAIGMSEIYEKAMSDNSQGKVSPLLATAEKLVSQMKGNQKSNMKQINKINEKNEKSINKPSRRSIDSQILERGVDNLYAREMAMKNEWEKKRKKLSEDQKSKELEGITFSPKLENESRKMVSSKPDFSGRMASYLEHMEAKRKSIKKNNFQQYKEECPFKPITFTSYCSYEI